MSGLLPELYLHGLAERDFDLALRGLLGEGAPLSASSIARLKTAWEAEYDAWRSEPLADLEPVYLWVDVRCNVAVLLLGPEASRNSWLAVCP